MSCHLKWVGLLKVFECLAEGDIAFLFLDRMNNCNSQGYKKLHKRSKCLICKRRAKFAKYATTLTTIVHTEGLSSMYKAL